MNLIRIKFSLLLCFLFFCFCSFTFCQTNEIKPDSVKTYDEIIDLNKAKTSTSAEASKPPSQEIPKDELSLLLPLLNNNLYQNWILAGEQSIWKEGDDLLNELKIEKILQQTYKNENHVVDILIYKFKDFTGAYSAYTVLHTGATTKLRVGKNASESDKQLNFWKGNYYVDIHTLAENDSIAKSFIILVAQDISKNIKDEQLPPVVAIQLPALSRVQGSEKYCLGPMCSKKFFSIPDFEPSVFKLSESGGIITAQYQLSDSPKDKERITLFLARYLEKETAQEVFNDLKEIFEKKKEENKNIDLDLDVKDSIVMVKNGKNDYTMFKQRGNLLAIAYGITNKKSGEKILDLVPWPIEIAKPTNQL